MDAQIKEHPVLLVSWCNEEWRLDPFELFTEFVVRRYVLNRKDEPVAQIWEAIDKDGFYYLDAMDMFTSWVQLVAEDG